MMNKDFDCVEMKRAIQEKIAGETAGLSSEEKRRCTEERILSDPILASIWQNARRIGHGAERFVTSKYRG